MTRTIKHILPLIFLSLFWGNGVYAQLDSVAKATNLLQDASMSAEKRIKAAAAIVDKAIEHPQSKDDAYSWYIRGYIYKEWYKVLDANKRQSQVRLASIDYLKKSLNLFASDTSASALEYAEAIKKTMKYLASTLYNDAGALLDPVNYKGALENFEKYKECMLLAQPGYNLVPRDIEFNNALATVFEKVFRSDIKNNKEFFGMTEALYKQVLALDTNNWHATYNLAMLYYNFGVDMINNMSIEVDLVVIDNIQEEARVLFKKALPYALKAYSMRNDRVEVLRALQGIYFSLYEFEKSEEFKAKIAALGQD